MAPLATPMCAFKANQLTLPQIFLQRCSVKNANSLKGNRPRTTDLLRPEKLLLCRSRLKVLINVAFKKDHRSKNKKPCCRGNVWNLDNVLRR